MRPTPSRRPLAALVVAAALAAAAAPAGAQADGDSERRAELQEAAEAASAEEARLLGQLDRLDGQVADLNAQVSDLDDRLADEQADLSAADAALDAAAGEAAAADRRYEETSDQLRAAEVVLRDQAVSEFVQGGTGGSIAEYLQADDLRELRAVREYADAALEHSAEVVEEVDRLREELGRRRRDAARAEASAGDARAEAEARREAVASARDSIVDLRDRAASVAATRTEVLERVRARRTTYEAELAAIDAVSSSIAQLLAARQAGQLPVDAVPGMLRMPLRGARLTSPFGLRVHPIYGTVRLHAGMDLAAPSGTPVTAAADAVVVSAAAHGGYGLAVVLDHGGALATLYGHLSRLLVRPGDVVRRGDRIGLVGSTGASTGPHLHFEVRVSGTPTDPTAYLRRPAPRREAPASVTAG
jgi:murein DD-endopeptidase MepM/ murein hydrolase activator NlpD